jgi:hypothetical protein
MGNISQQHKTLTPNLKLPLITHNNKYKLNIENMKKERKAKS